MEQDVCSFILSVDVRIDQTIFRESSHAGLFLAEEEHGRGEEPPDIDPVAGSNPLRGGESGTSLGGGSGAPGKGKGSSWAASANGVGTGAGAGEGEGYAPSSTVHASSGGAAMYKEAMPGMLRLEECLHR